MEEIKEFNIKDILTIKKENDESNEIKTNTNKEDDIIK